MNKRKETQTLTRMSIMAAIIIMFHIMAQYTSNVLSTSINLSLVALAICAITFGYKGALILSGVSGLTTVVMGIVGFDKFTNILFNAQPVATIAICMVKIMAAAVVCTFLYKLLCKKNEFLAVIVASLAVPVVNTGLFILGGLTIVSKTLTTEFVAEGTTLIHFVLITCCLINFTLEFSLNAILSPAIKRISKLLK